MASCGGSDGASTEAPVPGGPDVVGDGGPAVVVPQADYLIVAASTLAASAERFKTYRASEAGGSHKVALSLVPGCVGAEADAVAAACKIRDHVKAQYDARDTTKPFFLLIVGDAAAGAPLDKAHVPSAVYFEPFDGSNVATDNLYADMDGDHIPDLAVGRIPLATDAEVDVVLEKTTRYESTYEVGDWNKRLNLFASTSGFGDVLDAQIETLVFAIVEDIPYDYDITLTYAKQTSPYVFVPEKFSDMVYDRLNQGSLMMAYVGHGNTDSFADLVWNGKSFPILDTAQLGQRIEAVHKPPLLTLIACLTGAFASGDSVSEQILRTKNGPVGILSSTEISHPYANAIFIRELAQGLTTAGDLTAGELFVDAKRRMVKTDDALRRSIDMQVAAFVGVNQQGALKRSHQYMYTLFGDPAARLAYPKQKAKVTVASAHVAPGAEVAVAASFAGLAKGQAHVTLEVKRTTISGTIAAVPADGDATRDAVIAANYATANNRIIAEKTAAHDGAAFSTTLAVPANAAPGDYFIKVYADDGKLDALGSTKITVP